MQPTDLAPAGFLMSVVGREHPFADLGVYSILTGEMPSRGMAVPGWEEPDRHVGNRDR